MESESERRERILASREQKRKKSPWVAWDHDSDKSRAQDTYFQGCGHTMYRIPYSLEFIENSGITLIESIACKQVYCQAVDEWKKFMDVHYIQKYMPPAVTPVNIRNNTVISKQGIVQGPYTHQQWLEYSYYCWDLFHDVYSDTIQFNEDNRERLWLDLYCRNTGDFCAGSYNNFSPFYLLMARTLSDDYSKHLAYSEIHSGADLFHNIAPIDPKDAKQFRNHGKIFNVSVPHRDNCKKLGLDPETLDTSAHRKAQKSFFQQLRNRTKKKARHLSNFRLPGQTNMQAWYKPIRHIPLRLINNGKTVTSPIYPNNDKHIQKHWNACITQITKFIKAGSLRLMPENFVPELSAGLVLANAENPLKKVRCCYDGGSIKLLEGFKSPCQLEGLDVILRILKRGDRMCKLDDSAGFHLLKLHKESTALCAFQFDGRYFEYSVLPFGERKSPASYQQANHIPLSYARTLGISVTCYLDDRLIAEPTYFSVNGRKIETHWGRNTFLVVLLILSGGGFINLEKSQFKPTLQDEFLGMNLNTESCTISVPKEKWDRFQQEIVDILEAKQITLERLEQFRGNCCSFIIASKHVQMFIRKMTEVIKDVNEQHKGEIHHFFKNHVIH